MTQDLWWQLTRVLLQMLGTFLFTRGIINAEMSNILYSEAVVGAIIALGSAGWGVYVKWHTKAVPVTVVVSKDLATVSNATGERVAPPSKT